MIIEDLLKGNIEWVNEKLQTNPSFFEEISKEQKPQFLWIGCSDSRVPVSEITNTPVGSIFVQRNIANMVIHTDSNLLSVVNYAITVLKVKHIIVCGHYGCGGVKAAMGNQHFGFLDNWLMHIKDVYRLHQNELNSIEDYDERFDRFVELNIQEQVGDLAKISFIQEEWKKNNYPHIHGWVYSLKDGLLKDLNVSVNCNDDLENVYKYIIK